MSMLLTCSFLGQIQAQDWTEITFDKELNGVRLDTLRFDKINMKGSDAYLYFTTARSGSVQSKGLMGAKGDERYWLHGILEIVLDAEGQVSNATHKFFKPKGVTGKEIEIIDAVKNNALSKGKVIASGDDIIDRGITSVIAVFPNFRDPIEMDEDVKEELPQIYYRNKVKYAGIKRKVSAFVKKKYTLRAEGEKSKVGSFLGLASDYDLSDTKKEIDDYRNTGKEAYWMGMTGSTCERATGNVYAMHQKIIKKGKYKSYMEYEYAVFDKEGEVTERVDKKFDIPQVLDDQFTIYKEGTDIDQVDKRVYVMKDYDMMGMAVKKTFGDKLNYTRRHVIITNNAGKLEQDMVLNYEQPTTISASWVNPKDEVVLIGKTKPLGISVAQLPKSGEPVLNQISEGDPLLQNVAEEAKEIVRYKWKLKDLRPLAGGKKLTTFSIEQAASSSQTSSSNRPFEHHGYYMLAFDENDQPFGSFRLGRAADAILGSKAEIGRLNEVDAYIKFLITDPTTKGNSMSILTLNKTDFSSKVNNVDNLQKTSYFVKGDKLYLVGEQAAIEGKIKYKLITAKL